MDESILQETLKALEASIAEKEEAIKLGEALTRLKATPDYQLVIQEHFIDAESKRLFNILTDPSGASPYTKEEVNLKLEALSLIKAHMGTEEFPGNIMAAASSAPDMIDQDQIFRTKITAEYAASREEV